MLQSLKNHHQGIYVYVIFVYETTVKVVVNSCIMMTYAPCSRNKCEI